MKKFIAILIVFLFASNVTVFGIEATNTVTVNPVFYDAENNSLVVSGYVDAQRDKIPMTLYISSNGRIVAAGETMAVGKTERGVQYNFDPICLDYDTPSGDMIITVTAGIIGTSATATYTYMGIDKQYEAMTALQNALAAENSTAYVAALHTYKDNLGVDVASFDNLNNVATPVTVNSLMKRRYTLPSGYDTKEKCLLVQNAVKELNIHFREAMVLGKFFNASDSITIRAWYESNKTAYSLLLDDTDTTPDESKMVKFFDDIFETEKYMGRREYMTSVTNVKELNISMKQQAILQTIEDSGQHVVKSVVTDFNTLLTQMDYSMWELLSDDAKTNVCISVAGKSYKSIELLCEAINSAVVSVLSGGGNNNSYQGGTGSALSKKDSSISVSANDVVPIIKPAIAFEDINSNHWAWESIRYLYDKEIISGRSQAIFAPDDNVTRAELVKMIVLALGLSDNGTGQNFNDISNGSWYADYVKIVSSKGIVFGDDDGNFNPNQPITRQDAAVIIYRALNPEKTVRQAAFDDYAKVSDYAKTAVDYMSNEGIISGMGDGCFEPQSLLSRAQCAKILHLTLIQ